MPPKRLTPEQVIDLIISDDEEDLNASDYGNESDVESEFEASEVDNDSDSGPMMYSMHRVVNKGCRCCS